MMNFIFDMQTNMKVFYKLIVSFWLRITRHVQSTQNKFAYLCSISRKGWGMNMIFCQQVNREIFYKLEASFWVCMLKGMPKVP